MTSVGPQLIPASTGTPPRDPAIVWIPQTEYDNLLAVAHRYSNLCQNLIGGGVTQAVIEVLSNNASPPASSREIDDLSVQPPSQATTIKTPSLYGYPDHGSERPARPSQYSLHGNRITSNQYTDTAQSWDDWVDSPSEDVSFSLETQGITETEDAGNSVVGHNGGQLRSHFERVASRSLQISNLPDDTTHADITAIVRGGALLDVYIRRKDSTASIAFVHAEDAQAFYDHARRRDLYIRNKRVLIKWSDRHYTLPGYVAQKLGAGATRNIVIRRCDPSHTEASIREDLEHIHNLVVVKLMFLDGNCHISTNSVANAMFARTCMMSRLKYKGSRIEWDLDECAVPLKQTPTYRPRNTAIIPPHQPIVNAMTNRFEILNLDG